MDNQEIKIEPGFLTLEQASQYTQIPVGTLRKYVYEGKMKASRPGRRLLFKKDDLDKWVKSFPAA